MRWAVRSHTQHRVISIFLRNSAIHRSVWILKPHPTRLRFPTCFPRSAQLRARRVTVRIVSFRSLEYSSDHSKNKNKKTGTFLNCDDPVHGSYYKNGAATQTLRLLGGSQYFPRCSYNAYLPPYTTNFDFVVSQIQNTGWLDTRTWLFHCFVTFLRSLTHTNTLEHRYESSRGSCKLL